MTPYFSVGSQWHHIFQLGLNDTINREAFAGKAQALLSWNPPMAAILANAARTCPEPPNLQVIKFLIFNNFDYS